MNGFPYAWLLSLLWAAAACAPDAGPGADAAPVLVGGPVARIVRPPFEPVAGLPITPECQGIDFAGIQHSPGGEALPNACAPFHPTDNNPYAVRCIDAWPWYDTGFPGDSMCILPPPPGRGLQYGFHPQGDRWHEQLAAGDMGGYREPDPSYLVRSGQEDLLVLESGMQTPGGHFYRTAVRQRPGTHHLITWAWGDDPGVERWSGPETLPFVPLGGVRLPAGERLDEDQPNTLAIPSEDRGLYFQFPANPGLYYDMHHFNPGAGAVLRESWVNVWWVADAQTPIHYFSSGGLDQHTVAIEPYSTLDQHYFFELEEPLRLLSFSGHRHAWTTNLTAWVERAGGGREILFQSFDWQDTPFYRYDSQAINPAPAPAGRTDGGASGVLRLEPGDRLHFNCHVSFTDARAAELGAPAPAEIGPLHFSNEAITGEMCFVEGTTVEAALPLWWSRSEATPPDFAVLE